MLSFAPKAGKLLVGLLDTNFLELHSKIADARQISIDFNSTKLHHDPTTIFDNEFDYQLFQRSKRNKLSFATIVQR